ncbi:bacitracin resistance protein [Microbacterium sp. cx-59]|uniref:bacitracin resistance protein n=1 Tax=Microbacterium sp. cx-59 TaxID=2891207 RepID=UPI001E4EBB15|nr:bacitracin resistance protein [Microbacterium sp. cx-59]MCC4907053.1 bacitracin resistance protein [Microbacterium sp. cx-59]
MAHTTSDAPTRRSALPVWLVATIAGGFGLFYAWAVWTAVSFLAQQASGVEGLTGYGWFVLVLPVLFPILAFAGAFALGWRRRVLPFVLVMLTGLALVAVFWLDVLAYASVNTSLYGG